MPIGASVCNSRLLYSYLTDTEHTDPLLIVDLRRAALQRLQLEALLFTFIVCHSFYTHTLNISTVVTINAYEIIKNLLKYPFLYEYTITIMLIINDNRRYSLTIVIFISPEFVRLIHKLLEDIYPCHLE